MKKTLEKTYRALPAADLRWTCPEKEFPWPDTTRAPALRGLAGQERALAAIDFGLSMPGRGFNLFLIGEPGCGKATQMLVTMTGRAAGDPVPPDWCYVHDFRDPRTPLALSFPPGKGRGFAGMMKELAAGLKRALQAALEDKDLERRRAAAVEAMRRDNAARLEGINAEAGEAQFMLEKSGDEWVFIPTRDGNKLAEEAFNELPDEEKAVYEARLAPLREDFKEALKEIRHREEAAQREVEELNRAAVRAAVAPRLAGVAALHPGDRKLLLWLEMVEADLAQNFGEVLETGSDRMLLAGLAGLKGGPRESPLARYEVNLLVDNGSLEGAPVVTERNPAFYNLIGKLEYSITFGMASTSFTQIRPGALHRANGGYLLLDALEVLRSPFAWEALKTALKGGSIQIEDLGEQYRLVASSALRPEPIPLSAKVVLTGPPDVYYLLRAYDDDFAKLFKVKADFGTSMKRTRDSVRSYAGFIASVCGREGLLPFAPSALAAVTEFGCRDAADQGRLSTRFAVVADLAREASYWAGKKKAKTVNREHVTHAEGERIYRHNRIEERLGEFIEEGTLLVETRGRVTGQVNGLSVFDLGDYAFAKPTRVTAKVTPGKSGMVQIDREVKLSGPIHSKGVLIVGSYLAERYALDYPLSLSASVTFEQTYEEVEGDSASAAEFLALVSAIAGIPLSQGMAVTGSIDQHGRVQPVGGVNEKIEGFFTTCRRRGLTGKQGVIFPRANARNLMLSHEVVKACAAGKFGVFAVEHLDQVIEISTGYSAGQRNRKGDFPHDSFNARVEDRLRDMADLLRGYEEPLPHDGGAHHEEEEKEEEKEKTPKKGRKAGPASRLPAAVRGRAGTRGRPSPRG